MCKKKSDIQPGADEDGAGVAQLPLSAFHLNDDFFQF
jgi:hypothetical protein